MCSNYTKIIGESKISTFYYFDTVFTFFTCARCQEKIPPEKISSEGSGVQVGLG